MPPATTPPTCTTRATRTPARVPSATCSWTPTTSGATVPTPTGRPRCRRTVRRGEDLRLLQERPRPQRHLEQRRRRRSRVHFGNGMVNAFWDGTQMSYGDGAAPPADLGQHLRRRAQRRDQLGEGAVRRQQR